MAIILDGTNGITTSDVESSGPITGSTIKSDTYLDASGGNTATINGIPLRPGVLDPENRIYITSQEATTFVNATTTYALGNRASPSIRRLPISRTPAMRRSLVVLQSTVFRCKPMTLANNV